VDHGTEFQSRPLEAGAYQPSVQLVFILPGDLLKMPSSSCLFAVVETVFECAPVRLTRRGAGHHQRVTARLHRSLGHLTPDEFVAQRRMIQAIEETVCSR
jgi:hypothetical protein